LLEQQAGQTQIRFCLWRNTRLIKSKVPRQTAKRPAIQTQIASASNLHPIELMPNYAESAYNRTKKEPRCQSRGVMQAVDIMPREGETRAAGEKCVLRGSRSRIYFQQRGVLSTHTHTLARSLSLAAQIEEGSPK